MPDRRHNFVGHEHFSELCALYPTGALSEEEMAALQEHLSACEQCRTLLLTYRQVVSEAVPLLAPMPSDEGAAKLLFPMADAKRALNRELYRRKRNKHLSLEFPEMRARSQHFGPIGRQVSRTQAFQILMLIGSLLLAAIFSVWWLQRGAEHVVPRNDKFPPTLADRDLLGLGVERETLRAQLNERDAKLRALSTQIQAQLTEISSLKEIAEDSRVENVQSKSRLSTMQSEQEAIKEGRNSLEAQLNQKQDSLASLQEQLKQVEAERRSDLLHSATLEARVAQLSTQLGEQRATVNEQQSLLASDRDIRELMGARDLYIADVFDVDPNSHTQKPFGRVFYTKQKSLIFYAFDLDQQRGLKSVSAFQAWGLGDSDKKHPVSLGIFYQDNQANRRWVLKFEDPNVLSKINAVFVTVEPKGGSTKPSGKQLLYAYLSNQPNHP